MSLFSLIKNAINPNYENEIAQIQAMGFSAEAAEKYLKRYNGDVRLAVEHLLVKEKKRKEKRKAQRQIEESLSNVEQKEPLEPEPADSNPTQTAETGSGHKEDSTLNNAPNETETISKPEEFMVICKCRAKMKLLQPEECQIQIGLRCNNLKCKKQIQASEWFYHCIQNSSNTAVHKGPYNYCYQCAALKMRLIAEQKQKKQAEQSQLQPSQISTTQQKTNEEWTPSDIYDIFNKVNEKLTAAKSGFLNGKNSTNERSLEEIYDLTENQVKLLYLIPDEMHQHAAIWIKATDANALLMKEYQEVCQELFSDIEMEKFPHFVAFGCDDIEFEQLPVSQKYAMQRVLLVLATHHMSLSYCPQIVHLIGVLLSKMDEKCVFALCHSMLIASRKHGKMYFTFSYLENSIRIQTLLSFIDTNVKTLSLHLKHHNIDILALITRAMESMFIEYLTEETFLCLIDTFFQKGYKSLLRFGVALIRNCQKQLCETSNICEFKNKLKTYSKSLTVRDINSWSFSVYIWDTSIENLEISHKDNRQTYANEPVVSNIIRIWPKWDLQKIRQEAQSAIFTDKWSYYQVWAWLPQQCHLGEMKLLFNTAVHGYKLISLYYCCMNHENLVILIRTRMGEIFGAFVSTIGHEQHWKNFLSDPRAFVFVLSSNGGDKYVQKRAYQHMILSVLPTKKSLSIGYERTNLMFIDEGLKHGFSDECKELNYPPLCSGNQGQFEISCIEVWSVEHEYHASVRHKESIHDLCESTLHRLSTVLFGGRQHSHNQYASF